MRTQNFPEKQNDRRKGALQRLEAQLKKGTKEFVVRSKGGTLSSIVELTSKDRDRIGKEIAILKGRVVSSMRDKKSKKRNR